jgi:rSAM/selenodomain-associated transferase 2
MKISVIIPVFNEQNTINKTISTLKDCEIIVSDCNGRTLDVISDESVVKVLALKGRSVQMNMGAERATGDVLIFLHADTALPENWQNLVENSLETADYGAFLFGVDSIRPIFSIIEFFTNIRCKISRIPYGDQAIFIKKSCFKGFENISLFEDVRFIQNARSSGLKFRLINKKVRTSTRRWKKDGILRTTFRNRLLALAYMLGVHPDRLKQLYSDKR